MTEPIDEREKTYTVVAVDDGMCVEFEKYLTVSREPFEDGETYTGGAHVDLPMNLEDGNGISDITARFYFKQIAEEEMVLVLLDIHVM